MQKKPFKKPFKKQVSKSLHQEIFLPEDTHWEIRKRSVKRRNAIGFSGDNLKPKHITRCPTIYGFCKYKLKDQEQYGVVFNKDESLPNIRQTYFVMIKNMRNKLITIKVDHGKVFKVKKLNKMILNISEEDYERAHKHCWLFEDGMV